MRFNNIICRSECGVYIASDTLGLTEDIRLDNVKVELSHWSGSNMPEEQGGQYDRRPTATGEEIFTSPVGIAGFHLQNIEDIKIRNCEVIWRDEQPYWGSALYARNCHQLTYDLDGKAGKYGLQSIDVM